MKVPNGMTVKQLIDLLGQYPDDMVVHAYQPSHDYWRNILAVGVRGAEEVEVVWTDYHEDWQVVDEDRRGSGDERVHNVLMLT